MAPRPQQRCEKVISRAHPYFPNLNLIRPCLPPAPSYVPSSQVLKLARASVESQLEKDASLQQRSVEAALKSLREGAVAEDRE